MAVPRGALATIPARGGSKGIPGKNLQEVGGVPLVCRSIQAAQASKAVGRVIVSTDDDAIAAASEAEGAGVIRRPAAIAGDTALVRNRRYFMLSSCWSSRDRWKRSWCSCNAPPPSPPATRSMRC